MEEYIMNEHKDHIRQSAGMVVVIFALVIAGCSKQTQQKPVASKPAETPATQSAESMPASAPAPTPIPAPPVTTRPASTYDPSPPYPVQLNVKSPDEKQPGWLRILEKDADDLLATANGRFPRQNRFSIDTNNVKQIRIHVSHLPLAPRKRIILHIDQQGIEILRKKGRDFVTLERRPTGEWIVVKEAK